MTDITVVKRMLEGLTLPELPPVYDYEEGYSIENAGNIAMYVDEKLGFVIISVRAFKEGRYDEESIRFVSGFDDTLYFEESVGPDMPVCLYGLEAFMKDNPHSGIEEYMKQPHILYDEVGKGRSLLLYCLAYMSYPIVEQLCKAGFAPMLRGFIEGINRRSVYCVFDVRGKDIRSITRLPDHIWKNMVGRVEDSFIYMAICRLYERFGLSENGLKHLLDLMEMNDSRLNVRFLRDIEYLFDQEYEGERLYDCKSLLSYLSRCIVKQGLSPFRSAHYLYDYDRMCIDLGVRPVYRPDNLIREHNVIAVTYRRFKEEDEKRLLSEKFKKRYERLKGLSYSDGRLTVVVPEDVKDLYEEGKNNHNCVASYASRHAEGTSNIFFIRKASEPDKSYITVELDRSLSEVLQAYYSHNFELDETDRAFIDSWLREINIAKE